MNICHLSIKENSVSKESKFGCKDQESRLLYITDVQWDITDKPFV